VVDLESERLELPLEGLVVEVEEPDERGAVGVALRDEEVHVRLVHEFDALVRGLPGVVPVVGAQPASNVVVRAGDASGGGGSQFTDIPPAVAAAQPGDRIVVRPGGYSGFTVRTGIAVMGQPGASLSRFGTDSVNVRDLPAGANCTISGLDLGNAALAPTIEVANCAGKVSLENLATTAALLQIRISDSTQVSFRDCSFDRFIGVERSTVAFHDCTLVTSGGSPLWVTDSDIVLSRCTLTAGPVLGGQPGGAALVAFGSRLTITGDGSGTYTAYRGPAIYGGGTTLLLDDDVLLVPAIGSAHVSPQISTTIANVPSLSVEAGATGAPVNIDLYSEAGDLYFLIIGLPGTPLSVPGLQQRLWIDPGLLIVASSGVLDASARTGLSLTGSTSTAIVGVPLMWQGLAGTLSSAGFSNAPVYTHGL